MSCLFYNWKFWPFDFFHPFTHFYPLPLTTTCSLYLWACCLQIPHLSGIIQYLSFSVLHFTKHNILYMYPHWCKCQNFILLWLNSIPSHTHTHRHPPTHPHPHPHPPTHSIEYLCRSLKTEIFESEGVCIFNFDWSRPGCLPGQYCAPQAHKSLSSPSPTQSISGVCSPDYCDLEKGKSWVSDPIACLWFIGCLHFLLETPDLGLHLL